MRDLVAVAEHLGGDRGRNFRDEGTKGCVACAQQVDAVFPEPVHEGVGVDMVPGAVAREEPLAAGTASGAHVGPGGQMLCDQGGERFRYWRWVAVAE